MFHWRQINKTEMCPKLPHCPKLPDVTGNQSVNQSISQSINQSVKETEIKWTERLVSWWYTEGWLYQGSRLDNNLMAWILRLKFVPYFDFHTVLTLKFPFLEGWKFLNFCHFCHGYFRFTFEHNGISPLSFLPECRADAPQFHKNWLKKFLKMVEMFFFYKNV